MGGGGVMRAAAKVAGIGVAKTSTRGAPMAQPTEQSMRNASRPVSAVVSSQGAKATEVAPLHTAASWDTDDWEVANVDSGELIMEAGEPMPRVVFDAVPSFQEAKAATDELKEAIDKVYLSADSSEGSSPGSQVSVFSPTRYELETKSRVIEAISKPSVPKHALQAFQMLSTSHEVQTVVTSIACDPNVWNGVMQNPAVNNFFRSYQTDVASNCAAVAESEKTPEKVKELPEAQFENGFFNFNRLLENLNLTVTEMLRRVSSFIQNMFPSPEKSPADAGENAKASFMDSKFMGGTFMGLAMMAVMVVLLKRA